MNETDDRTIAPQALHDAIQAKTAFVIDVRMAGSGEQIPTSRQYDPKQIVAADPLVLPIPTDATVAVVGSHEAGEKLHEVVEALVKGGFQDVRVLEGGYRAWTDASLPTEELTLKQPVAGAAGHQLFR